VRNTCAEQRIVTVTGRAWPLQVPPTHVHVASPPSWYPISPCCPYYTRTGSYGPSSTESEKQGSFIPRVPSTVQAGPITRPVLSPEQREVWAISSAKLSLFRTIHLLCYREYLVSNCIQGLYQARYPRSARAGCDRRCFQFN
jgi:hypothetical protein